MKLYERYSGKKLAIAEKIQQRRRQILVHSYIYYELDESIVSDSTWAKWAQELVELQAKFPNMSKKIPYAEEFQFFDGSTGAFLQYDESIIDVAYRLLEMKNRPKVLKPVKKKCRKNQAKRRLF